MSQDPVSGFPSGPFPQRILAVAFRDLCNAISEHLDRLSSPESASVRQQRRQQLEEFMFHLESMAFLDGEHRGESIMTRLLRWSGPGFTRRFYITPTDLTEESFFQDHRFVTRQMEELLRISHYQKLPPHTVEKALNDASYEKIFVRLQHVDFLNFYVRGSYIAKQKKTLTRSMANKVQKNGSWVSTFIHPDSVMVYEEIVVIASEEVSKDEEFAENGTPMNGVPPHSLDKEQMVQELEPYLEEQANSTLRPLVRRRRAIQEMVKQKMRNLQGKSLDEIMAEHTPDSNRIKHLFLIVYHNIPETDLELLLPFAEISLGIKEYVQLCFTGTATLPALGRVFLNRGLRKILFFFNPLFYGIYRVLYKMNVVKTEQKFQHVRYLLNHRLAQGGKAVSHLIDDYENVLKREALLIYAILAFDASREGLTRIELECRAKDFVQSHWTIPFEPNFTRILNVLWRWGVIQKSSDDDTPRYTVPRLDELIAITALTRENLAGKIWME